MNMEKETWIENILNSTNGISQVNLKDGLFSRIQQKIKNQDAVSSKTVWLVAASIAVLVLLNISVINSKSKSKQNTTTAYLAMTIDKSNQLY
jgi:hypothetical protein